MGVNTLVSRSNAEVVDETWFNEPRQALTGELVGRNASTGAPEAGNDLGTVTFPWGNVRCSAIILNGQALDPSGIGTGTHKIVSGKTRSSSNQPAFLTPAGSGNGPGFTLDATPTPLNIEAAGVAGSFASDVVVSGLATAPGSDNTCTVNDTSAADQEDTRRLGEPQFRDLVVDNMGSEITALIGTYAAFKVDNGSETEYFFAHVLSSTILRDGFRGFFYGSDLAPINRIPISDGDTITLLKAHWVFADVDGETIATTTVQPAVGAAAPDSPSTGDYWFDLANKLWKRYDGSAFQTVNRVLIGVVAVDGSDCVAARCFDYAAAYDPEVSMEVTVLSTSLLGSTGIGQRISVAGNMITFQSAKVFWDMANDLAGSEDMYDATEQADRTYYFYITDSGAPVISDISPYFRGEMAGWYHPHNPWRCIVGHFNDVSSNLGSVLAASFVEAPRVSVKRAISGSCGNPFTTTSTSFVDVTNLGFDLRTSGRPVVVMLVPDGAGRAGVGWNNSGVENEVRLTVDGVDAGTYGFGGSDTAAGPASTACAIWFTTPEPGTHSFRVQARRGGSNASVHLINMKLVGFEVP